MRIAGIVKESIVDGPGLRYVIFTQGCPHHCVGCHNPSTHDFKGGYEVSWQDLLEEIKSNPLLRGVTFSGGEPVCAAEDLALLADEIKKTKLDIIMYSGYTYEQIIELAEENPWIERLIKKVDYLVDGPFKEEEKDLTLLFRGSRNQNIIDVQESIKSGIKKCLISF